MAGFAYRRHEPEKTLLHELVRDHIEPSPPPQ
jgi:hypothetical protein